MNNQPESFKEYEARWQTNKKLWQEKIEVDPPKFPVYVVADYPGKLEIFKVDTLKEIFHPDFLGTEWDKEEYIIDSFLCKYQMGYIIGDPVGFVYPQNIEKQLTEKEIGELFKRLKEQA